MKFHGAGGCRELNAAVMCCENRAGVTNVKVVLDLLSERGLSME